MFGRKKNRLPKETIVTSSFNDMPLDGIQDDFEGYDEEQNTVNVFDYKRNLYKQIERSSGDFRISVGLPMSLSMFEYAPIWHTFFRKMGVKVVTTNLTSQTVSNMGMEYVKSPNMCLEAKILYGHIDVLSKLDVQHIFLPVLAYKIRGEGETFERFNCPLLSNCADMIRNTMDLKNSILIDPMVYPNNPDDSADNVFEAFAKTGTIIELSLMRRSMREALLHYELWRKDIRAQGAAAMEYARENGLRVLVLAGRPYTVDPYINKGIDKLAEEMGYVVVTYDSINIFTDPSDEFALNRWSYHEDLYRAAKYASENENCDFVEMVLDGCMEDLVCSEKLKKVLAEGGKEYNRIILSDDTDLMEVRALFSRLLKG